MKAPCSGDKPLLCGDGSCIAEGESCPPPCDALGPARCLTGFPGYETSCVNESFEKNTVKCDCGSDERVEALCAGLPCAPGEKADYCVEKICDGISYDQKCATNLEGNKCETTDDVHRWKCVCDNPLAKVFNSRISQLCVALDGGPLPGQTAADGAKFGSSVSFQRFADAECKTPNGEKIVTPPGCFAPGPGQFAFTGCTSKHWGVSSPGSGTCGGFRTPAPLNLPLGECVKTALGDYAIGECDAKESDNGSPNSNGKGNSESGSPNADGTDGGGMSGDTPGGVTNNDTPSSAALLVVSCLVLIVSAAPLVF